MDPRISYPSHSGIMTFLRAPYIYPEEAQSGEYVVLGAPFDSTTGSRPGSRYGPNSIRQETAHFIYHLTAIDGEVIDVDTKKIMTSKMIGTIKDAGDVRVFHNDVKRTTDSIAEGVRQITSAGAFPVVLGGDHYIAYPSFVGFAEGLKQRLGREPKLGYIHFDSHLDGCLENETWGQFYQGDLARRVSEHPYVDLKNMVWIGINGQNGLEPYNHIVDNGGSIYTSNDIQTQGVAAIIEKALRQAEDGTDFVYVTIDIDVVDHAYAAGTGCFVYGGITAVQLLEFAAALSKSEKIAGLDFVEVSPRLDPTQNTSRLAATALLSFLKPRLFEFR